TFLFTVPATTGLYALALHDALPILLGGFAGNLALGTGARGGVYLGGGILPRLRAALAASAFRARFLAKGRFAGYLEEIPLALIRSEEHTSELQSRENLVCRLLLEKQ